MVYQRGAGHEHITQLRLDLGDLFDDACYRSPVGLEAATEPRQDEQAGELADDATEPVVARAQRQRIADQFVAVGSKTGQPVDRCQWQVEPFALRAVRGDAAISRGAPCASIRPRFIRTTVSASANASDWSWVT